MTTKILVLCLSAMFMFGCNKGKKPIESPTDSSSSGQDTNIQSKDMTFDVQGSDSGNISGLYSIHFDFDKASLTAEGRELAQKNADWMKANPNAELQIEGHCDRHGSIEYNLGLGERRAKTVKSYLANLGVASKRLSIVSYGKERQLDSSESESADQKNRRANFVVKGQ